jgi:hypothetical protein
MAPIPQSGGTRTPSPPAPPSAASRAFQAQQILRLLVACQEFFQNSSRVATLFLAAILIRISDAAVIQREGGCQARLTVNGEIQWALEQSEGRVTAAADVLDLPRSMLRSKIDTYGLASAES